MLKNYFKIAYRNLLKNKTYTVLNILGLGVGIASGILLFMYVYFHLSTDKHHPLADRIYRMVLDIDVGDGSIAHESGVSVAMVEALENDYSQVEKSGLCMFFYTPPMLSVSQPDQETKRFAEREGVAYANEHLLYMLDYEFLYGNKATALLEPGQTVITASMAHKLFGTEQALGKTINISNKADLVVSGVVKDYPATTDFKTDMLVSLPTLKVIKPSYQMDNFSWIGANNWVFVQLAEGFHEIDLESQLAAFRDKYLGEGFAHWQYHLQPLSEIHFDENFGGSIRKSVLQILIAVGIFMLAIACINFINLSTASSARRHMEVGVRKVMGSSLNQLFWQFITETALITSIAFGLGGLLACLLIPEINAWLKVSLSFSIFQQAEILLSAIGIFIILVLLAGAYPAILIARLSPQSVFRTSHTSHHYGGGLLRKSLVTAQFVMAQVFAIGAMVAIFQIDYFRNTDPGFAYDDILSISIPASNETSLTGLRNQLMQHAEVVDVSMHYRPPMTEKQEGGYVKFVGEDHWRPFLVRDRWADEHYLETFDLELVAGRNIQLRDSTTELLVNENFVEKLSFSDPELLLSQELVIDNTGMTGTIVGVVKDFHQQSLQHPIEPVVIYPFSRLYRQASVKLQTKDLNQSIQDLHASWQEIFPDQVFQYNLLDETMANMYQQEATAMELIRLFAVVTIIICCMGLYGLMMFVVHQKVKEIGIRKVLGASVPSIIQLLSKSYLRLVGVAFILAVPLANYIFSEWLQNFSYHIELKWWFFVLPGLMLMLLAWLSISKQTLQAAYKNPVESLRDE